MGSTAVTVADLCVVNENLFGTDVRRPNKSDAVPAVVDHRRRRSRSNRNPSVDGPVFSVLLSAEWRPDGKPSSDTSVRSSAFNDDRLSTPEILSLIKNRPNNIVDRRLVHVPQVSPASLQRAFLPPFEARTPPNTGSMAPASSPTIPSIHVDTAKQKSIQNSTAINSQSLHPSVSRTTALTRRTRTDVNRQLLQSSGTASSETTSGKRHLSPIVIPDVDRVGSAMSTSSNYSAEGSMGSARRRRNELLKQAEDARRLAVRHAGGARGARFIDILHRIQARKALNELGLDGSSDLGNSAPAGDDDGDDDARKDTVADRLQVGTTGNSIATSSSRRSSAVSSSTNCSYFSNIRELNQKIVMGRASRHASAAVRPSTSIGVVWSWEEGKIKSTDDTGAASEAGVAPGDQMRRQKSDITDLLGTRERRSGVVERPSESAPKVPTAPIFYEPPLVPLANQNTECKFYAGINEQYRLPERLPEIIVAADMQLFDSM